MNFKIFVVFQQLRVYTHTSYVIIDIYKIVYVTTTHRKYTQKMRVSIHICVCVRARGFMHVCVYVWVCVRVSICITLSLKPAIY